MTPISVRSVDELIAVLPHSLGHQPADALVVVVLSGRTPLFTARLPLHDEDGTLSCPREVGRQVGAIVAAALRNGGHAVHAVAFEEHRGDSDAAIEALEHHVREGAQAAEERGVGATREGTDPSADGGRAVEAADHVGDHPGAPLGANAVDAPVRVEHVHHAAAVLEQVHRPLLPRRGPDAAGHDSR